MSPGESNGSGELTRVREALASVRGKQRLDVILSADDPGAIVSALPADELWMTIREIGLGEAAELVQLASPEQFRVFLDLEGWRGDELEPRRVLPWLRVARAGAAQDDALAERWKEKLSALDLEVLELAFLDTIKVHDLDEDPDPEYTSDRFMRTPEGRFSLEFTATGAEYMAVRGVVDDLYAEDPFKATRLFSAIRSELPSDLVESALRWRQARLADLGYPTMGEALSWYARPPRAAATPAGAPDRPPGFFLQRIPRGSLLERAAAGMSDDRREQLEAELVAAANAVLVANVVDVDDVEAVRRSVDAARALVEIGLEALAGAGGDPAPVLATTPVKRVFQHGFAQLLSLRAEAERVLARAGKGSGAPLLDAPLGEALAALVRKRPLYHPGLALQPGEWGHAAAGALELRPFLSREDLQRARDAVAAAGGLVDLGIALGILPSAERPERIRLGALYLTALANERLGRGFVARPVPADELPAALAAVASIGDEARLASAGPAGALLLTLARAAAEELEPLRAGDVPMPQPESIAGLWVE
ncbi:MAG TPA: DUF6178 family protein [Anaeromyxobacteraceae bacterium]|nr:DUF6178 family protein [Anaeromyxobacteraceae bacterium]